MKNLNREYIGKTAYFCEAVLPFDKFTLDKSSLRTMYLVSSPMTAS